MRVYFPFVGLPWPCHSLIRPIAAASAAFLYMPVGRYTHTTASYINPDCPRDPAGRYPQDKCPPCAAYLHTCTCIICRTGAGMLYTRIHAGVLYDVLNCTSYYIPRTRYIPGPLCRRRRRPGYVVHLLDDKDRTIV